MTTQAYIDRFGRRGILDSLLSMMNERFHLLIAMAFTFANQKWVVVYYDGENKATPWIVHEILIGDDGSLHFYNGDYCGTFESAITKFKERIS